jgi:ribosomal protein S18 acetylase RimI-like enzyme
VQGKTAVAGITLSKSASRTANGLRPVNLQTDLPELADLIETAFANTMDAGGRAAIREMRQLSRVGLGLGLLSNINELAQGMSMGFVWVADGQVVGNVSVYPADYPRDMGKAWIIANVAVYPEYRGRGIATQLMQASLDMIRSRSSGRAILQVDLDNEAARHLYRKLGFIEERAWTQWRRGTYRPYMPDALLSDFRIVQRRLGDAENELRLAQMVRPQVFGGLDWLRPTHIDTFRLSPLTRLGNWLNLRSVQRLVIRDDDRSSLLGWMQIETAFGASSRQLLLMAHPNNAATYADALVRLAVRRFSYEGLTVNHPHDDDEISGVLRTYQFTPRRTVVHMRHDLNEA